MTETTAVYIRIVLILLGIVLVLAYVFVRTHQHWFSRTRLRKHRHPRTGEVTRVYIERRSLRAKLWLQKRGNGFEVRHAGTDADFTVTVPANTGEAIYLHEAREALQDVGLDINRCTWDDVLRKAI